MIQLLRNALKKIPGVPGAVWWLKYQVNSRQFPDSPAEYERRWSRHISDELRFWDSWLRDRPWPDQFEFRTDPRAELQPELATLLPRGAPACKLLDVGAGPLSALGKRLDGTALEISATDALAEHFDRLLEKNQVIPPVRTVQCNAERLTSRFSAGSFDLVFCQNALDHAYDPVAAIDEMVRVLKPAGSVFLRHFENEGYREAYSGLHQWNFTVDGGDFVIWNPRARINLSQRLAPCSVQAAREKTQEENGADFVVVVIRKTGT
jgi:ubiquinone/menaquinone biosynthesis C-methylase UbiE